MSVLSYRWNKEPHFSLVMFTMQEVLRQHTSLKSLFESCHHPDDLDINPTLIRTMDTSHAWQSPLHTMLDCSVTDFTELPDGFRRFSSSPVKGSACKRWHMLLRWMVRTETPDLGLWSLPVHIVYSVGCPCSWNISITRLNNTTQCQSQSRTGHYGKLKAISPTDPIQYDFALAHRHIWPMQKGL